MYNELFTNVLTNFYFKNEENDTLQNLSYTVFQKMLKTGEFCVKFNCYKSELEDVLITEYTLSKKYVIL